MDLKEIENRILKSSSFVKEVEVVVEDGSFRALIHPNLDTLEEKNIINIESEIRWYAIELYNMEVSKENRITSYKILYSKHSQEVEIEPKDEIYSILKSYLSTLTDEEVFPSSHIELNLGLDSIEYVELFIFIENSFGVVIDEKIFSKMMIVNTIYEYIKEKASLIDYTGHDFEEFLKEPIDEKLVYSPYMMFFYKAMLYPFFKLYFRMQESGVDNVPASPCIIAPSHQSMLDGFLIVASLPYSTLKKSFFLAFKQVFGAGILKPMAIHGQNILIDANEDLKGTMQYSALPLRKKGNLVIFPEGARSRDRELLEFRPFFAMLAKTFNLPIVPVVIDGSFEALASGKSFPLPKKIKVTYLKAIYPQNHSVEELTKMSKDAIAKEMKKNPVRVK